MLIQRVITALVLLPGVLALVWFAPTQVLYAVFAGAGLLIAWEWAALMRWTEPARRWSYVAIVGAMLLAVGVVSQVPQSLSLLNVLTGLAVLWWLVVPTIFPGFPGNLQRNPPSALALGMLGVVLIASTVSALAQLHAMHNGPLRLLFVLFLVFAADTGAFLAGRSLGRHKLAPGISPGKTVEGAIGGVVLCALWALTAGVYVFEVVGAQVLVLVGLSIVVALASIVGDLTESMFKRMVGIKDSGTLLPGHGGILDRVDSILAAAPVMLCGLYLTGL
ncbi:phosphatidate cytidylyltransferase [Sinimarinibacterium sp. CAU 1509]|uniref:phosphatidate cytidylyltransferase n=1 Tax=Sinimarinibacterium sp. CAU 1509 TaxID=2562283 RepID=UPI0010AB8DBD|nr:phosphatidate cytidylyltransferase [Sinimarinibacterium sp. CAU 1509]TJY62086.1 phosphatidate cytidylyltransferase [Sinimarinibacterium sp. CAU 1509]